MGDANGDRRGNDGGGGSPHQPTTGGGANGGGAGTSTDSMREYYDINKTKGGYLNLLDEHSDSINAIGSEKGGDTLKMVDDRLEGVWAAAGTDGGGKNSGGIDGRGVSSDTDDDEGDQQEDDEPPYSFEYEIYYFFKSGIPLGLSNILSWGVPPWVAVYFVSDAPVSNV